MDEQNCRMKKEDSSIPKVYFDDYIHSVHFTHLL